MKEENLGIVIGSILSIDKVKNTDRLFAVKIKVENRELIIATSLASFYKKEDLIGKQVPIKIDVKPPPKKEDVSVIKLLSSISLFFKKRPIRSCAWFALGTVTR